MSSDDNAHNEVSYVNAGGSDPLARYAVGTGAAVYSPTLGVVWGGLVIDEVKPLFGQTSSRQNPQPYIAPGSSRPILTSSQPPSPEMAMRDAARRKAERQEEERISNWSSSRKAQINEAIFLGDVLSRGLVPEKGDTIKFPGMALAIPNLREKIAAMSPLQRLEEGQTLRQLAKELKKVDRIFDKTPYFDLRPLLSKKRTRFPTIARIYLAQEAAKGTPVQLTPGNNRRVVWAAAAIAATGLLAVGAVLLKGKLPAGHPASELDNAEGVPLVVSAKEANLRKCAGTGKKCASLAVLHEGEPVKLVGNPKDSWLEVEYTSPGRPSAIHGFMSRELLKKPEAQ